MKSLTNLEEVLKNYERALVSFLPYSNHEVLIVDNRLTIEEHLSEMNRRQQARLYKLDSYFLDKMEEIKKDSKVFDLDSLSQIEIPARRFIKSCLKEVFLKRKATKKTSFMTKVFKAIAKK